MKYINKYESFEFNEEDFDFDEEEDIEKEIFGKPIPSCLSKHIDELISTFNKGQKLLSVKMAKDILSHNGFSYEEGYDLRWCKHFIEDISGAKHKNESVNFEDEIDWDHFDYEEETGLNFEVGDEILCKNTGGGFRGVSFEKGKKYKVIEVDRDFIKLHNNYLVLFKNYENHEDRWLFSRYFVKI